MATEVKDEEDVVDGIELVLLLLEFNVIEAVEVLLTGVLVVADGDGGGRAATGLVVRLALANGEAGGDELGGVGGGGCCSSLFMRVFSRNFLEDPEGRRRIELLGNTGVCGGFSLTTILLSSSLSAKKEKKRKINSKVDKKLMMIAICTICKLAKLEAHLFTFSARLGCWLAGLPWPQQENAEYS